MTATPIKPRRRYSAQFKQQVLAECARPGASLARVALSHGIHPSVVRKWRPHSAEPTLTPAPQPLPAFIALELPTQTGAASSNIHIELHRGSTRVTLSWPVTAAEHCAAWMRAWLP